MHPTLSHPSPQRPTYTRQVDIYNHLGRSLNVAYMYGAYENAVQVQLVMELCTGAWVGGWVCGAGACVAGRRRGCSLPLPHSNGRRLPVRVWDVACVCRFVARGAQPKRNSTFRK